MLDKKAFDPKHQEARADVVPLSQLAFALRAWRVHPSRHPDDHGRGSQSSERVTAREQRQKHVVAIWNAFQDFMETPTPPHWAAVMAAIEPLRAEVEKMIADEEEEKQMHAFVDADPEVRRLGEQDGSEPEDEESAYEAAVERAEARYASRRS
jgi:hypothetical protein